MSNFLEYIKEDIELKTSTLSSMPDKTKTNINNLTNKLDLYENRYKDYKVSVKKYIEVKAGSIDIKDPGASENKMKVEKLLAELKNLQELNTLLNPMNTYFEKIGFDALFYDLSRSSEYDFTKLNNIIKSILDKFSLIKVVLTKENFCINSYVNEYMTAYLEAVAISNGNYTSLEPIFEKIYWVNPNLVNHIELQFRRLIRKHRDKFESYSDKIRDEAVEKTGANSYEDYLKKLKNIQFEMINLSTDSITEIIKFSKDGVINIRDYMPDSNLCKTVNSSLIITPGAVPNEKISGELKKLKNIVLEFKGYNEFTPFIELAKTKFKNYKNDRQINDIGDEIEDLEDKLRDISDAIFGGKEESSSKFKLSKLFSDKSEPKKSLKELEADSIKICDRVLELYKLIDEIKFNNKLKETLSEYSSLDEFLNVYSSYNYYKYQILKEAFKIDKYEVLMDTAKRFDEFCTNPNNVVITSIPVFNDYDIAKLIVNKYRLNNINLTEESLKTNGLDTLSKYIDIYLRLEHIKACNLTAEKIWFIVEASKLNN